MEESGGAGWGGGGGGGGGGGLLGGRVVGDGADRVRKGDRQQFLELAPRVPAGALEGRRADDPEAAAGLFHVGLQRRHGRRGQRLARHAGQDDPDVLVK